MKQKKLLLILSLFLITFVFLGCQEEAEDRKNDELNEELEDNQQDEADESDESEGRDVAEEDESDQSGSEEVNGDLDEDMPEENPEPLYEVNQSNWGVEPIEDGVNEQVVLLTIDDVPDKYGVEMAHILNELDAPAIFFVNGHFIQTEEQQAKLREIHELGFAIGNHTYSHPVLSDISEEEQRKEIVELNDLIEEIIGERPKFFRAPHGVNTDFSRQVVEQEGMVLMNWTYGYDYFAPYMDKEKLTEAMITGEGPEVDVDYSLLKPGANLLMHDREWTKEALADIVTGLREKGYETVDPNLIRMISE